jgi:glycosyltransferase involved in cell wall biosynthesis
VIKISIIMPAYNEQATIIRILELVAEQVVNGIKFEVIVIDDCSTDMTVELLKGRPELYTKLVELSCNGGKGAAVRAGLLQASGDYILFQDADLEYDPGDYEKLVTPVLRFDADVVMGSRMVGSSMTRVSYFWHKVGNILITFIFNILNNTTFTDVYSCFLLYRRCLVRAEDLKTEGWEQHAEILTEAIGRSKICFEVPISYYGRTYDEGKKIRAYHVLPVVWTMFMKRLGRGNS